MVNLRNEIFDACNVSKIDAINTSTVSYNMYHNRLLKLSTSMRELFCGIIQLINGIFQNVHATIKRKCFFGDVMQKLSMYSYSQY